MITMTQAGSCNRTQILAHGAQKASLKVVSEAGAGAGWTGEKSDKEISQ